MKIIVYGTGCCSNCDVLYKSVKKAIDELGISVELEKETDIEKIMSQNIMSLPALSIDGKIVSQGKKLSSDEVKTLISAQK